MSNKFWVVIPAAGVGKRMKSDCPKQYLQINGMTVLDRTIAIFIDHPAIAGVAVGISAADEYWSDSLWAQHARVHSFTGGKERSDTVLNGLCYLLDEGMATETEHVLVHDAARPLLSQAGLEKVLNYAGHSGCISSGCILALPCRDTIKRQSDSIELYSAESLPTESSSPKSSKVETTLDRSALWQAQTPQCFPLGALRAAIAHANEKGLPMTDESSAMEMQGWQPALIEGDVLNFKITSPDDLRLARALFVSLDTLPSDKHND